MENFKNSLIDVYNKFLKEKNIPYGILYAFNVNKTKLISLTKKDHKTYATEIGVVGCLTLIQNSDNKKETMKFLLSEIDKNENIFDYELIEMDNNIPIVKKINE